MTDAIKELIGKPVVIYREEIEGGNYFGVLESYNDKELFLRSNFYNNAGEQELAVFPRGKWVMREAPKRAKNA